MSPRHHLVLLIFILGATIVSSCSDPSHPTHTLDTTVPLYHSEWEVDISSFAVDGQGNLHVAQFWESDVRKYSSDGTLLDRWFVIANGDTLRVDALTYVDSAFVVLARSNVLVVDENYMVVTSWPERHLRNVTGGGDLIDADNSGNLYVLDDNRNLVVKYTLDGQFEREWRIARLDSVANDGPSGIAADDAGRVFVSDTRGNRILVYDAEGTLVRTFGKLGYRPGQLHAPLGLAVSGDILYVADLINFRIQKFSVYGGYLSDFYSRGTHGQGLDPPESVEIFGRSVFVMHENSIIRFDYSD